MSIPVFPESKTMLCPTCGRGATDIGPMWEEQVTGYFLPVGGLESHVSGTCANGHRFCVHARGNKREVLKEGQAGSDWSTK